MAVHDGQVLDSTVQQHEHSWQSNEKAAERVGCHFDDVPTQSRLHPLLCQPTKNSVIRLKTGAVDVSRYHAYYFEYPPSTVTNVFAYPFIGFLHWVSR